MNINIRWSIGVVAASTAMLVMCAAIAAQPAADVRRVMAPSGKLRVGVYPGSPTSMIQDASAGQRKGLTYDLGTELAKRLGVPFEPVVFQRVAEVVDALKSGQIDFTITNASPARVKDLDFTPTVLDLELGYVVVAGSPVSALASLESAREVRHWAPFRVSSKTPPLSRLPRSKAPWRCCRKRRSMPSRRTRQSCSR
jgi:polar amino acid transport system substrate-binding protein